MQDKCKWCARPRLALPTSHVLICATCDLTPVSSIPILGDHRKKP